MADAGSEKGEILGTLPLRRALGQILNTVKFQGDAAESYPTGPSRAAPQVMILTPPPEWGGREGSTPST